MSCGKVSWWKISSGHRLTTIFTSIVYGCNQRHCSHGPQQSWYSSTSVYCVFLVLGQVTYSSSPHPVAVAQQFLSSSWLAWPAMSMLLSIHRGNRRSRRRHCSQYNSVPARSSRRTGENGGSAGFKSSTCRPQVSRSPESPRRARHLIRLFAVHLHERGHVSRTCGGN